MDIRQESLKKHYEWGGKIEVISRAPINTREDLSLAYTPGVAEPCLEINKDYNKSFELTRRHNLVAVITDGTAILGLGDIGPEAGMPVMEGKCALFKAFADVDAFPICVRSKDVDEIVRTIYLISGSFGGINLEDISAPRCFEIERKLKENRFDLNDLLMQMQSDFSSITVQISANPEATAAGAAFLAGLAVGFFVDREELKGLVATRKSFEPCIEAAERDMRLDGWHRAVAACRKFSEGEE